MKIGQRNIGPGHPVYVIAEMSANHQNQLPAARDVVHAAHRAGADAIKLQTYLPETMTINCDASWFQIGGGTLWEDRQLYDLYGEAYTPWEWQEELKDLAESLGLDCFSTPFDATSVEFLETLNVPAYKIASFELVDHELLQCVAQTGKPVILSTGMANREEVDEAVEVLRRHGAADLALLKCTSAYPAPPAEMNLRTIPALAKRYQTAVGLSDHTLGTSVPVAAVALGACIVEKHFTLTRQIPGPDSDFSLEPPEFRQMVDAIRTTEQALGEVRLGMQEREQHSSVFRRSLFIVEDVRAGEVLTRDNLRAIRPGYGLPPKFLPEVLGRTVARDISRGTPLAWEHLAERTRRAA